MTNITTYPNGITGKEWVHPTTGETRIYLNDWLEAVGVELSYYGTGNICYAELDGKKVSNNTGKSLKAMKAWIGSDGEVHVKINDRARFYIKEATLIERIKEALKEGK